MKTNPNDSVNPVHPDLINYENIKKFEQNYVVNIKGLSKREQFSAMAMQGLLSNNYIIEQYKPEYIAEIAIKQADYLIEALNKES